MSSAWLGPDRYPLLLHRICLLYAVNEGSGQPKAPSQQQTPASLLTQGIRYLPLKVERHLAQAFAYLAAATDDPKKIVAVSIQELGPRSLQVNLAVNHGQLDPVHQSLKRICSILQNIGSKRPKDVGTNAQQASQTLIREIISLSKARILVRLRSKHAVYKSNFAKVKKAQEKPLLRVAKEIRAVCAERKKGTPQVSRVVQREVTLAVNALNKLEMANGNKSNEVEMLVTLRRITWHCFLVSRELHKQPLSAKARIDLKIVHRLARYQEISDYLLHAARKYAVFQNLRVMQVLQRPMQTKKMNVDSWTTKLISRFLQEKRNFKLDELEPSGNMPKKFNVDNVARLLSNAPTTSFPVHAEVQLLVHHESQKVQDRPRVICSNKLPCLLCYLLFEAHGGYVSPGTHGRLYHRWALPAAIEQLAPPHTGTIKRAVDSVASHLEQKLSQEKAQKAKSIPQLQSESLVGSRLTSAADTASSASSSRTVKPASKPAIDTKTARSAKVPAPSEHALAEPLHHSAETERPSSSAAAVAPALPADRSAVLTSTSLAPDAAPFVFRSPRLALAVEWSGARTPQSPAPDATPQRIDLAVQRVQQTDGADGARSRPAIDVAQLRADRDTVVDLGGTPWQGDVVLRHGREAFCLRFVPRW